MARQGIPIVLSAPSGTGKTTLAHLLVDSISHLSVSVSYTTRPARGNEREGIDYHFVSQKIFEEMIEKNDFLEWAKVYEHLYGSGAEWTNGFLAKGTDVVFDIDVQGGLQIKEKMPKAVLIFILPPSIEELEFRLRTRGTDSDDVIAKRMEAARQEIDVGLAKYDFVITNEKLDRALFDLTAVVRTHRLMDIDRKKQRKKLLFGK